MAALLRRPRLLIAPVDLDAGDRRLVALGRGLEAELPRLSVAFAPAITASRDATRRQCDALPLLASLERRSPGARVVLGVTDHDLFIPTLTHVFGLAQLGGRAAVVSLHRLGQGDGHERLAARALGEALHEIGHCAGLPHCHFPGCVMVAAGALDALDLRTSRFCASCGAKLTRLEKT